MDHIAESWGVARKKSFWRFFNETDEALKSRILLALSFSAEKERKSRILGESRTAYILRRFTMWLRGF